MNYKNTMSREGDIRKVLEQVVNAQPCHDRGINDMPDETSCPFCHNVMHGIVSIDEIKHSLYCAYTIAKDLLTK